MPVQSLPIDVCQDIAAYIHPHAGKGHLPYTRDTARSAHAQLSLSSKTWLELSRRISFEEVSIIYAYKIVKFFELIDDSKKACTFTSHIRRICFGELRPTVRPSNGGNYPYGWLGDYFNFEAAIPLFPNLQAVNFNCIFVAGLPEIREFRRLEGVLTKRSPITNITQLSIRVEFFDGVAALYDFIHNFPDLNGLILRGITSTLVETLPFHLPSSVRSLKLVENTRRTALGESFLRPCTKSIRQPARNDVVLRTLQYVHFVSDESLDHIRTPFFLKMSHRSLAIQIYFPRGSEDHRAWGYVEESKLHEQIIHGIADVVFYDSLRRKVTPERLPFYDAYQTAEELRLRRRTRASNWG